MFYYTVKKIEVANKTNYWSTFNKKTLSVVLLKHIMFNSMCYLHFLCNYVLNLRKLFLHQFLYSVFS